MKYVKTTPIQVDESILRSSEMNRHKLTITDEMIEDRAFDIVIFNQYNDEWRDRALDELVKAVRAGEASQRIIDTLDTFACDYWARQIAIEELNEIRNSVSEF